MRRNNAQIPGTFAPACIGSVSKRRGTKRCSTQRTGSAASPQHKIATPSQQIPPAQELRARVGVPPDGGVHHSSPVYKDDAPQRLEVDEDAISSDGEGRFALRLRAEKLTHVPLVQVQTERLRRPWREVEVSYTQERGRPNGEFLRVIQPFHLRSLGPPDNVPTSPPMGHGGTLYPADIIHRGSSSNSAAVISCGQFFDRSFSSRSARRWQNSSTGTPPAAALRLTLTDEAGNQWLALHERMNVEIRARFTLGNSRAAVPSTNKTEPPMETPDTNENSIGWERRTYIKRSFNGSMEIHAIEAVSTVRGSWEGHRSGSTRYYRPHDEVLEMSLPRSSSCTCPFIELRLGTFPAERIPWISVSSTGRVPTVQPKISERSGAPDWTLPDRMRQNLWAHPVIISVIHPRRSSQEAVATTAAYSRDSPKIPCHRIPSLHHRQYIQPQGDHPRRFIPARIAPIDSDVTLHCPATPAVTKLRNYTCVSHTVGTPGCHEG